MRHWAEQMELQCEVSIGSLSKGADLVLISRRVVVVLYRNIPELLVAERASKRALVSARCVLLGVQQALNKG